MVPTSTTCITTMTDDELREFYEWAGNWAIKLTPNNALREDLRQVAVVRVWEEAKRYDPARSPNKRAFLRQHGKWAMFRHLKNLALNPEVPIGLASEERHNAKVIDPDRSTVYHYPDVHNAVASLPYRERKYVLARFWADMTYTELVKLFGYDPSGSWTRTKRKLRQALSHLESVE